MRIRRAFALGLLVLIAAGCGGGGKTHDQIATAGGATPSPSSSAGTGSGDEKEQFLKHSQCMRENGVPNFPDPKFEDGGGIGITLPKGVDPKKLEAAEAKCKQYLPNGGEAQKMDPEQVEQMREYAQCMRENGLPDFPDPTDEGLRINGSNPDLAPDSPKMKAAHEKCRQYQPKGPNGESGGTLKKESDG